MPDSDFPAFTPERPPIAELQSLAGVQALLGKAVRHLEEDGATCGRCGDAIDVDAGLAVILGRPAPLFACGQPACAEDLRKMADYYRAPMLAMDAANERGA